MIGVWVYCFPLYYGLTGFIFLSDAEVQVKESQVCKGNPPYTLNSIHPGKTVNLIKYLYIVI